MDAETVLEGQEAEGKVMAILLVISRLYRLI